MNENDFSDDNRPLISIGIPTFNRAASLKRSLDSALAQDYTKIEVIVSDNCSTDSTQSLCEFYQTRHPSTLKYFRTEKNTGPIDNFNKALDLSVGVYFMWLADDDYIDRNYVSTCLNVIECDSSISIVGGCAKFFGAPRDHIGHRFGVTGKNILSRLCGYYWAPYDNSIYYGLMRTEAAKIEKMRPVLAADWLFVGGMASRGGLKTLDSTFIHRQVGGTSSSLKTMVATMRLSHGYRIFPAFLIATNMATDILWKSKCFSNIPKSARLWYAIIVFCVAILRHGLIHSTRQFYFHIATRILGTERYERMRDGIKRQLGK